MKNEKNKIDKMLEEIDNFTNIEVPVKCDIAATIYLKDYKIMYELMDDDDSFLEALYLIYNIEMSENYCLSNEYFEDIQVFSAYDLLELRKAIENDKKLFGSLYLKYFYEHTKDNYIQLKEKTFNRQYLLDYIYFINRLLDNNKSA